MRSRQLTCCPALYALSACGRFPSVLTGSTAPVMQHRAHVQFFSFPQQGFGLQRRRQEEEREQQTEGPAEQNLAKRIYIISAAVEMPVGGGVNA